MKILHTSDWHIGRRIEDKSLEREHSLFFSWLSELIDRERVDVLIVSGDIFDYPFPSNSSLSLYYKALFGLSRTCLRQIIITGGNHDSVSTLNSPREILDLVNIKIVGGITPETRPEDLIFEVKTSDNKVDLVVCAVPFLREKDIRTSVSGSDYKEKIRQINSGIAAYYEQIASLTKAYSSQNIPVIATGHLFVNDTNSLSCDENELHIGGLQQLALSQIPDIFDYVALGHIHKPMKIGKKEHVRYCGSPINLSFSEANTRHQVVIVDFDANPLNISIKYIPTFRRLVNAKGTLNEVETLLSEVEAEDEKVWASVEVIEDKIEPLLELRINDLRQKFEHIDIIKLRYSDQNAQKDVEQKFSDLVSLSDLSPADIFEHKVLGDNIDASLKENLLATFKDLTENYLYEEEPKIGG